VLAWLCLLATLAYIHRSSISVLADEIRVDVHLDRTEIAHVMSAFFLGYSIFQLPGGWIGDRWGSRITLTTIVILWSAATGCMGLVGGFTGLYLCWLLAGAAQAGIFPCCVNTVSRWFPTTGRAFPNGMLGAFMSLGSVIGTSLTALLFWSFAGDWQLIFQLLALPGFVCGLLFFWWFRDRPQDHSWVNDEERRIITAGVALQSPPHSSPLSGKGGPRPSTPWLTLFTSAPMLLICGQQFFRAAGNIFFMTWFPTFLQSTRCVSVVQSGFYASVPLMGIVIGSAFGGVLMDWLLKITGSQSHSRPGVAVVSLLCCGTLVTLAYYVSNPVATILLLAFGAIGAGMGGPAAYTATIDMGGKHIGTVFSVMNTAGNAGAFVLPLLVNEFVKWRGWEEVLLLLAGLYFLAALCWSLIRVDGSIFRD